MKNSKLVWLPPATLLGGVLFLGVHFYTLRPHGSKAAGFQQPYYKTPEQGAFVVFCAGCHEIKHVTMAKDDRLIKSRKEASVQNIVRELRPGGKHPQLYTERMITDEELTRAARFAIFMEYGSLGGS